MRYGKNGNTMTGNEADVALRRLNPGDTVRIPAIVPNSADMIFRKVTSRTWEFTYADQARHHWGLTTRKDVRQCLVKFGHI